MWVRASTKGVLLYDVTLCGVCSGSCQDFPSLGSTWCQIFLVQLHPQPRKISLPLIWIFAVLSCYLQCLPRLNYHSVLASVAGDVSSLRVWVKKLLLVCNWEIMLQVWLLRLMQWGILKLHTMKKCPIQFDGLCGVGFPSHKKVPACSAVGVCFRWVRCTWMDF